MQLGGLGSDVSSPSGPGRQTTFGAFLVRKCFIYSKVLASYNVCLVKFYHESGRLKRNGNSVPVRVPVSVEHWVSDQSSVCHVQFMGCV